MTKRGRQPDDATGLAHAADHDNAKAPESNALLSYVRRRFPRIGLAVTFLVGAAAVLGFIVTVGGNIKTLAGWLLPAKPALPYVEIVFDRSQDMTAHLGNDPATKWDAARQALQHIDLSDNEYIGLRTFGGGPCPPKSGPLDLRFTRDGKGRLDSTLLALQPGGQGNLADSVIAAIDDFMNGTDFGPIKPRVVVIAGGNDDCTGDYVDAIKTHLTKYPNATLDFRLIGVSLTDSEKQDLAAIRAAVKGEVVYVNSREEISRALDKYLVWQPMSDSVNDTIAALNTCIEQLNKVIADLNQAGGGASKVDLDAARDECRRSDPPFRALGSKNQQEMGPVFTRLYDQVTANGNMRERIIIAMEKLVTHAGRGDMDSYGRSFKEFEAVRDAYNKQVAVLNAMLEQLKPKQ
jgi:hypothetical protein